MLFTVATDSMEMYHSRFAEERELHGAYSPTAAAVDHERYLLGEGIDHFQELGYWERKRIHNLKYFTWVEQQGKTVEELDAQWYDEDYWTTHFHAWQEWDRRIEAFNEKNGTARALPLISRRSRSCADACRPTVRGPSPG